MSKVYLRRALIAGSGAAVLAAAGWFGWQYWTVGRFEVSTDDAYVQADNTTIAPKVSGYVAAVLVGDNEPVKAGEILARIDDRDFRVALDQARADVSAASAAIATREASIEAQQSAIAAARAAIDVDAANLTFANQDDKRYASLAASGYGSVQNAQSAASRSAAARASVERDKAALEAAVRQVEVLKAELAQGEATLAHDQAAERQAELNLSYTSHRLARRGRRRRADLARRSIRSGWRAAHGGGAGFGGLRRRELQGDPARGRPPRTEGRDRGRHLPGTTLRGRVDSIAPASGQEFALLPPDNATGNFTKVVQRIPVKIVLDAGEARSPTFCGPACRYTRPSTPRRPCCRPRRRSLTRAERSASTRPY